jgi:hypothetical protein
LIHANIFSEISEVKVWSVVEEFTIDGRDLVLVELKN